jgi:hypothetical protein
MARHDYLTVASPPHPGRATQPSQHMTRQGDERYEAHRARSDYQESAGFAQQGIPNCSATHPIKLHASFPPFGIPAFCCFLSSLPLLPFLWLALPLSSAVAWALLRPFSNRTTISSGERANRLIFSDSTRSPHHHCSFLYCSSFGRHHSAHPLAPKSPTTHTWTSHYTHFLTSLHRYRVPAVPAFPPPLVSATLSCHFCAACIEPRRPYPDTPIPQSWSLLPPLRVHIPSYV